VAQGEVESLSSVLRFLERMGAIFAEVISDNIAIADM